MSVHKLLHCVQFVNIVNVLIYPQRPQPIRNRNLRKGPEVNITFTDWGNEAKRRHQLM